METRKSVLAAAILAVGLGGCGSPSGDGGPRDGGPPDSAPGHDGSIGMDTDSDGRAAADTAARDAPASTETKVTVEPSGAYAIHFDRPAWTFAGNIGVPATQIQSSRGHDSVGSFHEVSFAYAGTPSQTASIRAYDRSPAVILTVSYGEASSNGAAFPTFDTYPKVPYHVTYGENAFAPVDFAGFAPDSPFVFFDDRANTFILSAATNFMNASTVETSTGALASGIDPAITTFPAGFSHRTVLVADAGINAAYAAWGDTLLALTGKKRPATDINPELERFGYWTDHGAAYYYQYDNTKGYAGTLLAVRDYFAGLHVPLAYLQLDSWFYPKGPMQQWSDGAGGIYQYVAAPALFSSGLASFQSDLGLPLVTHARWIDPSSPYHSMYAMSNNVVIDPKYWAMVADYLETSGVVVYEQDWLDYNALPRTDNLTDQDAFTDHMAAAMGKKGLTMQYCMPLPRHFLQSTKYGNLLTTRVSQDRFESSKYENFLYASLLARSLGELPWVDTFNSSERDNLLLATLSAGMVGVGDWIGTASVANIFQAVRADGVIVKPDAPIVPLDQTFLDGARGVDTPLVAATRTDFGGLVASYVYAFNTGTSVTATFTPEALGYSGPVYVWSSFLGSGKVVEPKTVYEEDLVGGSAYWVIAPVGPSGVAFLGDEGKFVSLGKKRISAESDHGTLHASVVFASGESTVTVHGWAKKAPTAAATKGAVGKVTYDAKTGLFSLPVSPSKGAAEITLH